jgi:hypothetical protein
MKITTAIAERGSPVVNWFGLQLTLKARALKALCPLAGIGAPDLRAGLGPGIEQVYSAAITPIAGGDGVFRVASRANLSALNRAVFSRVAKRAASYSAVAF